MPAHTLAGRDAARRLTGILRDAINLFIIVISSLQIDKQPCLPDFR